VLLSGSATSKGIGTQHALCRTELYTLWEPHPTKGPALVESLNAPSAADAAAAASWGDVGLESRSHPAWGDSMDVGRGSPLRLVTTRQEPVKGLYRGSMYRRMEKGTPCGRNTRDKGADVVTTARCSRLCEAGNGCMGRQGRRREVATHNSKRGRTHGG
jgi:hypothetical protein